MATYRVLTNPDDGTSTMRARIVKGEGEAARVVAVCPEVADANYLAAMANYCSGNGQEVRAMEMAYGPTPDREVRG